MIDTLAEYAPSGLSRLEKMNVIESITADVPEVPEAAEHIAFVLNDMLIQAEKSFGGRITGYPLGAVLFAGDNPCVKNPSHSAGPVYLYLSMRVLFDLKEKTYRSAYWTMAHEVVHLLSRPDDQKATVLEEGMACWFQRHYTEGCVPVSWSQMIPSYAQAEAQVGQLLGYDPEIVKKMRQTEPTLSRITAENIRHHCPESSCELAAALSCRFARNPRVSRL